MADELVQVAWANDEFEAEAIQGLLKNAGIPSVQQQVGINGPQLGYGLLNPSGGSRRVMVHPHHAEAANGVLAETLVADENEVPEPVNAQYLEEGQGGRRPRGYGLIGAYARIYLVSFGGMALIFGGYVLLRTLGLT